MIIPNAEQAIIAPRKLRDYAPNVAHRVGGHKARLFAAMLEMSDKDAGELRDLLFQVVKAHDAEIGERDEHGQRYRIDFLMTWHGRQAMVRTAWIIRSDEGFPRLLTCYPI